jgi:cytoskeletal protein CcmA (bactofilin family)
MKNIQKILIILVITLVGLTLFSNGANAQTNTCQSDMVSTTCTIQAGETFNGNISIVNGNLTIENGGRLNGNLEAAKSDIQIDGWVTGNVTLALGTLKVDDSAHINGNVESLGAMVDISSDAIINGEQSILSLKGLADPNNWNSDRTPLPQSGSFFGRSIWLIFVSLALAALGLVAVLIFQNPAERMVKTIQTRPLMAFALGLDPGHHCGGPGPADCAGLRLGGGGHAAVPTAHGTPQMGLGAGRQCRGRNTGHHLHRRAAALRPLPGLDLHHHPVSDRPGRLRTALLQIQPASCPG